MSIHTAIGMLLKGISYTMFALSVLYMAMAHQIFDPNTLVVGLRTLLAINGIVCALAAASYLIPDGTGRIMNALVGAFFFGYFAWRTLFPTGSVPDAYPTDPPEKMIFFLAMSVALVFGAISIHNRGEYWHQKA